MSMLKAFFSAKEDSAALLDERCTEPLSKMDWRKRHAGVIDLDLDQCARSSGVLKSPSETFKSPNSDGFKSPNYSVSPASENVDAKLSNNSGMEPSAKSRADVLARFNHSYSRFDRFSR
mmetsp:Transcript_14836/g.25987  ORF Transcript_14836/g.25987 Transcript_14836/m.25987 type:complete len:119 (+) Transcript_14836:64-420(+)|eukprot:CAMPEP_0197637812 /NCGR_PEP_ID=MMETSP1338-20131121/12921_1 /TAXON_ID=43686 ORGANISM="Pelagodinium beii, Strain RCC1491" /NCGR_SAMPLE_ID=MMETSP1338 /ASSEMBLY_ACC=CAM_ASM_000754 /LENGTH=118 /DNA_ID=CAMNT_0043210287 /DNA_START=59 /DNA_END=415 /DNA_ORIENTATION=-